MKAKPIIFWGATGQAKVLAEFSERIGYRLIALFDNNPAAEGPLPDIPLFYGSEGFERWRAENSELDLYSLVAIGGSRGEDRMRIQNYLEQLGVKPAVAIHPSAVVAKNATVGTGSQILAGTVVAAETRLAKGCIINNSANVDHECVLADGVHIGPGAVLSGCVTVGEFSFIGAGAVVLPRLKIGRNVTIGAGSVVTKDIPDNSVAYGNPARICSGTK